MKLQLRHRVPDLQRQAAAIAPLTRRAARGVINTTLAKGRDAVYEQMRRVFDNPTPYTLNSLRVKPVGTTGPLAGEVSVKGPEDVTGNGIPAQSYLRPEILGGERRWKRSEKLFMMKGLLPRGWYMTPGPACELDSYGNWSRGQILKLLAYFQTFPPETRSRKRMRSNTSAKTITRYARGTRNWFGFRYFVQPPGAPGLKPGIWQQQTNAKAAGPVSRPRMVIAFVASAKYRQRLNFQGTLERIAEAEMPRGLAHAIDTAIASQLPDVKVTP